jgi:RNA polymerase I-specific transcription initiation factor RRN6
LENLQTDQDRHEAFDLLLSDLDSCPGSGLTKVEGSKLSDLLRVYDQVGEHWMASLPPKVSNLARLSKFKAARRIAVELCLSSIAVSLRKIDAAARSALPTGGGIDLPLHDLETDEMPVSMSPNVTTNTPPEAAISLPSPSRTPSEYSHISSSGSELLENTSIARLRQYAVSIKSRPDLRESVLISQWPSAPGVDPAQYAWRSMADVAEDELDPQRRREEARRRRKAERFLQRERLKESQGSSQPTVLRSSTQPELTQPGASSQSVGDIPMSQPDRGVFGARSAKPGQKKKGKRRAAGF